MGDAQTEEELARALAGAARQLLEEAAGAQMLGPIAELAASSVPGCDTAGILVLRGDGRIDTQAATSDVVRASDRAQIELGEGPCVDALRHQQMYRSDDIGNESRWPRYAPRARELGIGSLMGFQLFSAGDTLGALDLYSARTHAFDDSTERMGWVFASYAVVALAASEHSAQMRQAVETRHDIGEAMGIMMERHRMTSEKAFEVLRRASREHNVKLRDVARRVGETGEEPSEAAKHLQ